MALLTSKTISILFYIKSKKMGLFIFFLKLSLFILKNFDIFLGKLIKK